MTHQTFNSTIITNNLIAPAIGIIGVLSLVELILALIRPAQRHPMLGQAGRTVTNSIIAGRI